MDEAQLQALLQRAPRGSEEAHEVQSNYGQLLFSRSRLDEAEALLREALAGKNATLGLEHISTLITLETLAGLLHHRGELALDEEPPRGDQAAPFLEEAEALLRMALAAAPAWDSPARRTRYNLASLMETRGSWREAEALLRADLAARQAADPECPFTALSAEALASLLTKRGRGREAEEVLAAAGQAARAPYPPFATAEEGEYQALAERATAAEARFDTAAALRLFTEAAAVAAHLPATLRRAQEIRAVAASNLAHAHSKAGMAPQALEPLLRQAAAAFLEFTDLGHKGAAAAHNHLALTLEDLGRTGEALELLAQVLAVQRRALGPQARETLATLHNYGSMMVGQDWQASPQRAPALAAVALLREALQGRQRFVGERGGLMSLCSTQNSLATALAYLGQEGEAGALFASCARGVERLFADVEEGHRPPFATACAQGLQRLKRSQSKHRKRQGTANATTTTNATKARDSKARGPT
jgi:tetratricopeptide (TPR) repeat protein